LADENAVPPPAATTVRGDYPVDIAVDYPPEMNRFLPLVKWLLLIPHYVALIVLAVVGIVLLVASFFAVLFTGRYPKGMHDFMVGLNRWGLRVSAYMFLLTDKYPAFTLEEQPEDTVKIRLDYPPEGRIARWRPLVQWILSIPYAIAAGVLINLGYVLAFIAVFTILFTKKFPRGMWDITVETLRWQTRSYAYQLWLVDKYPPFRWEASSE